MKLESKMKREDLKTELDTVNVHHVCTSPQNEVFGWSRTGKVLR